ncbi:MAG: ribose-phosphate pyrophosphokinase, partial [Treponema sp.]|nr:ribose-phosphate pyrophosphokinase [Treponema sp.]
MPYCEPTSLGIVACPGGEAFADEVITHLKHMYKHRFTLKNDVISKRYELTKEELVQRINLENDLETSDLCIKGSTDKYRQPKLKIDT